MVLTELEISGRRASGMTRTFLYLAVWVTLVLHDTGGEQLQFSPGDYSSLEDATPSLSNLQGVIMFEVKDTVAPQAGVLYMIEALLLRNKPVRFQVWRNISSSVTAQGTATYKLLAEKVYTPQEDDNSQQLEIVLRLKPEEFVYLRPGDRFAIYLENSECPVATQFLPGGVRDGDREYVVHRKLLPSPAVVNEEVTFDLTVSIPRAFAVTFYYETDPDNVDYEVVVTPKPTSTTSTTMEPIVEVPPLPPSTDTLIYIGNKIGDLERLSTLSQDARAAFILPSLVLGTGKVKTFYAVVRRTENIIFQIWRPISGSMTFQLVGEFLATPDERYIDKAQPFPLSPGSAISTQAGDVLGFTNDEPVSSVAYTFNVALSSTPYHLSINNADLPAVGSNYTFQSVGIPWEFAIGVTYEIGNGSEVVIPPSSTMSSSDGSTPSPATTTSSPSKPTAPTMEILPGEKFLLQGYTPTNKYLTTQARNTFVFSSLMFPEDGAATSFWGYFVNIGTVWFQIWRPDPENPNFMTFIGEREFTPSQNKAFDGTRLDESEAIPFQKGDMVGFMNELDVGSIGYHFDITGGMPMYTASANASKAPGLQSLTEMAYPFKFAMAVTYLPGSKSVTTEETISFSSAVSPSTSQPSSPSTPSLQSSTTPPSTLTPSPSAPSESPSQPPSMPTVTSSTPVPVTTSAPSVIMSTQAKTYEPEDIISTASSSETTSTPKSSTTELPKTTKKSPNVIASTSKDPDWLSHLGDPWVIFALLIWAALVTLILLICCCCFIHKSCQKRKNPYKYYSYRSSDGIFVCVPSSYMGEMKEEDLLTFYNSAGNIRPGSSRQDSPDNNNKISNLEYSNNLYSQDMNIKTKL